MKTILLILLGFIQANSLSQGKTRLSNGDAIVGIWYCEALDKSTFKITKEPKAVYTAVIIKSSKTEHIGKSALKDVVYNEKKKIWEGTIITAESRKELNGVLELENENEMRVTGSLLWFKKTYIC